MKEARHPYVSSNRLKARTGSFADFKRRPSCFQQCRPCKRSASSSSHRHDLTSYPRVCSTSVSPEHLLRTVVSCTFLLSAASFRSLLNLPSSHSIISEFIDNGNLRSYIWDTRSHPTFPWRLRLSFATDIARALAYLHARKVSCLALRR
jgi:serine/threonine protein kinase